MILTTNIGRLELRDDTPKSVAKLIRDDIVGQANNPQDDHTVFRSGRQVVEWARPRWGDWTSHILRFQMDGEES